MAVLAAATPVSRAGVNPVGAAADVAGDSFTNDGKTMLYIYNGAGAPITLTLVVQYTVDSKAVTNPTLSVTNGEGRLVGPFPTQIYNDANGRVNVTYSAVATVTVKVLSLTAVS